jgi:hypothetical protein
MRKHSAVVICGRYAEITLTQLVAALRTIAPSSIIGDWPGPFKSPPTDALGVNMISIDLKPRRKSTGSPGFLRLLPRATLSAVINANDDQPLLICATFSTIHDDVRQSRHHHFPRATLSAFMAHLGKL